MLRIDEMAEVPQLGQRYLVPCVESRDCFWWNRDQYIPLFGGFHEDKEIIGFPEVHSHIDWRFVSTKTFRNLDAKFPRQRLYGLVASQKNCSDITYQVLSLKRPFPPYAYLHKPGMSPSCLEGLPCPPWMPELEEAHKDIPLLCNVCPHKGSDLSTIVEVGGVKTCPAHGLRWRGPHLVSSNGELF
jgi:hypothetical protein